MEIGSGLVKICKGVTSFGFTKGIVGGIFRLYRFHVNGQFDPASNHSYINTHAKAFFSGVADHTIGIDLTGFYGDFLNQKAAKEEAARQNLYAGKQKQDSGKA
ncbi:hypothetical protein GOV14_02125 [Candidatus Pacearchaeota archaeon]|nr:hypothetical protein [Candidatus Pacearchaeota archaeon]